MNHGIKLLALSLIKAWGLFAMGLFLIFYIKNKAVNVALDSLISPSVIFAISVITFAIIYYYIKNWKYITMPYSLKLKTKPQRMTSMPLLAILCYLPFFLVRFSE